MSRTPADPPTAGAGGRAGTNPESVDLKSIPVHLPEDFGARIGGFLRLLEARNQRLNLVSRKLSSADLGRHAVSSLAPLALVGADEAMRLLDVGSGGGLPAVPLLLARPRWTGVLVEATTRKCSFLREAARDLVPGRVRVVNARYEELRQPTFETSEDPEFGPPPSDQDREPFGLITLRAVSPERRLVSRMAAQVRRDLAPDRLLAWFAPQEEAGQREVVAALEKMGLRGVELVRVEWAGATLAVGRRLA